MCGIREADSKTISFSYLCCILYQKYGLQFARKISGLFSIVLIDENKKKLCLLADPFGSARPLYYYVSDKIIFSNQFKMLMKINEINPKIDEKGIALFLKYSYVPSPRTIIRGVFKLYPSVMDPEVNRSFRSAGDYHLIEAGIFQLGSKVSSNMGKVCSSGQYVF